MRESDCEIQRARRKEKKEAKNKKKHERQGQRRKQKRRESSAVCGLCSADLAKGHLDNEGDERAAEASAA